MMVVAHPLTLPIPAVILLNNKNIPAAYKLSNSSALKRAARSLCKKCMFVSSRILSGDGTIPALVIASGQPMARSGSKRKRSTKGSISAYPAASDGRTDLEATVDRGVSSASTLDRMRRPTVDDSWPSQPNVTDSELNVIEGFFSELVDEIIKR